MGTVDLESVSIGCVARHGTIVIDSVIDESGLQLPACVQSRGAGALTVNFFRFHSIIFPIL